ncbi:MAG: Crp/Fnr family transcriptional regulator [Deltaproteobacteria bacterium]|nr:Crp/Fnr family transcriptional regulator [Deltaproteobacteria bacterium]MBI4224362.1 Crp/Fnr family transcriptional regulator [Deltaproteobacteria bacterium]
MTAKAPSMHCQTCQSRGRSVFCDLSEAHLKELDQAKTTNHYKPRQVVFYEGNDPYGLYCIASGKIKIYKCDAQGHQQIVRLAGPGDLMGYRCLLADEPYSATAETIEEADICFVDKKTFFHVLDTHPATALHVLSVLASDLGRAENKMVDLVHKNIRERLAELLLVFQTKYGQKAKNGGVRLNITLTREELAELIGTTQESVIRLMSEFKQDGLIHVEGRTITLLDLKKLTETANLPE